jgi:hypothetical protein
VRRVRPGTGFNSRKCKPGYYTPWHHVLSACIEGIPTQVRSVPHDTARACAQIVSKNAFKVAIARFEDGVVETFSQFEDIKLFRMEGLDNPRTRLQSALDASKACLEAVDCLIFPELTFTPDIARSFAEHLLDSALTSVPNLPPLVVLGSYHEATRTIERPDTRNRALLLAHDGSQLMCFDKRSKVLFKFEPDGPDWAEALAPCETPYELLPLDAGLVGLAICKDLFDGSISDLLRKLDLDWLLVPSMSDKLTQHEGRQSSFTIKAAPCRSSPTRPCPARQAASAIRADTCSKAPALSPAPTPSPSSPYRSLPADYAS